MAGSRAQPPAHVIVLFRDPRTPLDVTVGQLRLSSKEAADSVGGTPSTADLGGPRHTFRLIYCGVLQLLAVKVTDEGETLIKDLSIEAISTVVVYCGACCSLWEKGRTVNCTELSLGCGWLAILRPRHYEQPLPRACGSV